MNNFKILAIIFNFFISTSLFATVGGPQYLSFLGEKDNSLYFLYEYLDESANPPEIWRYDLIRDTVIIDKQWINYPNETVKEALKRYGLDKIEKPNSTEDSIAIHFEFLTAEKRYMESMEIYYDIFPVKISWENHQFEIFQCFENETQPKVIAEYSLEDHNKKIAIVRFKGICFETGYEKDTLLIKPAIYSTAPKVEAAPDDEAHLYLVVVILIISITMMSVIYLRKKKILKK